MEEIWKKFENIEVSNLGNVKTRNHKDGTWGGRSTLGYKQVRVGQKFCLVHRLVSHLFNDVALDDPRQVDHINGVRDDNRVDNLRMVSRSDNNKNRKIHRDGGLVGCTFYKPSKKWRSQIRITGLTKHLGYFATELEAHEAYLNALSELK